MTRFFLGFLLLSASCTSDRTIFKSKNGKTNRVFVKYESFRGCEYIIGESKLKSIVGRKIFVEYSCQAQSSLYVRMQMFDEKGQYKSTWHAVSDTNNRLKFFEKDLITNLQTEKIKNTFLPISKDEMQLLNVIAMNANKTALSEPISKISFNKIIGWVKASD